MISAETRARLTGFREGIVRCEPTETPSQALRRFREIRREARLARETYDNGRQLARRHFYDPISIIEKAELDVFAASAESRARRRLGIKRDLVVFNGALRIPWGEFRRRNHRS